MGKPLPALAPCPFCGGVAYFRTVMGKRYITASHDAKCVSVPDSWLVADLPIKEQIIMWNRRVGDG